LTQGTSGAESLQALGTSAVPRLKTQLDDPFADLTSKLAQSDMMTLTPEQMSASKPAASLDAALSERIAMANLVANGNMQAFRNPNAIASDPQLMAETQVALDPAHLPVEDAGKSADKSSLGLQQLWRSAPDKVVAGTSVAQLNPLRTMASGLDQAQALDSFTASSDARVPIEELRFTESDFGSGSESRDESHGRGDEGFSFGMDRLTARMGATRTASAFDLGPTTADRAAMVQRIMDHASAMLTDGGGSVKLDLSSPSMGQLEIALSMVDNQVNIAVLTDSELVRDLVTSDINKLRDAFAGQSLTLGQVDVGVGKNNSNGSNAFQQSQQHQQAGQQAFEQSFHQGRQDARDFEQTLSNMKNDFGNRFGSADLNIPTVALNRTFYNDGGRLAVGV